VKLVMRDRGNGPEISVTESILRHHQREAEVEQKCRDATPGVAALIRYVQKLAEGIVYE